MHAYACLLSKNLRYARCRKKGTYHFRTLKRLSPFLAQLSSRQAATAASPSSPVLCTRLPVPAASATPLTTAFFNLDA